MVIKHHVQGYENFCKLVEPAKLKDKKVVYMYFGGSKESDTGESWCDDCQIAWPYIESEVAKLDDTIHFIYVEVGDRTTWKDPQCPFRKDKRLCLMVIPTLIKWNHPQKLSGDQCANPELVSMLFCDEEDD